MENGKHVGFRVADELAVLLEPLLARAGRGSRTQIVRDAIARGIALLEQEEHVRIGATAALAGPNQLRMTLTGDQTARVEALRKRATDEKGRCPVVRVFVLRECLLRGLRELRGGGRAAQSESAE